MRKHLASMALQDIDMTAYNLMLERQNEARINLREMRDRVRREGCVVDWEERGSDGEIYMGFVVEEEVSLEGDRDGEMDDDVELSSSSIGDDDSIVSERVMLILLSAYKHLL